MVSGADVVEQFRHAITAAGIEPPEHIEADGALHRFPSNGKRGDDSGWYVLHEDGVPAGSYGCWRSGISETWRAELGRKLTPSEVAGLSERAAAARCVRDEEERRRNASARERAAKDLVKAEPATGTPYSQRKLVGLYGVRQDGDALLVPMRDTAGVVHSYQRIEASGEKRYLAGGRVRGCYHGIGRPGGTVIVAEGYATAATIHEATGEATAVAFDAGNLEPVARALREKYPDMRIVIAADDDYRGAINTGYEKAKTAANAVGGYLMVPDFGESRPDGATDFNDLAACRGQDPVKRALERAARPEASEAHPDSDTASKADADPSGSAFAWAAPQPLTTREELEGYPLALLPDGMREAVAEVVDFVQCPPALAACSALSVLSLAGQGMADVRRADNLQGPVSLYVLAVAESGERKSSSDGHFLRSVREWESDEEERTRSEAASARAKAAAWEERVAGIRASIRDAAKKGEDCARLTTELGVVEGERPAPFRVPRVVHTDATPEALASSLANGWPSGGIMSAEAGIVFGGHAMGRDSVMRNLSLLNALWDGASHRVDRRTSESFTLSGARLTMGLAAQPETIRQFMEGTHGLARGNGFLARFLLASPQSTQGTRLFREGAEWRHVPAFARRVKEMLSSHAQVTDAGGLELPVLCMTTDAAKVWARFHDDVEAELRPGGELAALRDVASKAADNAARMAALFHLYAHGASEAIGAGAVQSAAGIIRWHLFQARAFLGEVAVPREIANASKLDAWLVDFCRRAKVDRITRRVIQNQGPNALRGGQALSAALRELADAGRVREVEEGRSKLVQVNPSLLGISHGA